MTDHMRQHGECDSEAGPQKLTRELFDRFLDLAGEDWLTPWLSCAEATEEARMSVRQIWDLCPDGRLLELVIYNAEDLCCTKLVHECPNINIVEAIRCDAEQEYAVNPFLTEWKLHLAVANSIREKISFETVESLILGCLANAEQEPKNVE